MEREKECREKRCNIKTAGGLPCAAILPFCHLPIFNFCDINNKYELVSDWIKVRIILIWWRCRDSNSGPKRLHRRRYMFRQSSILVPAADRHATKYPVCKIHLMLQPQTGHPHDLVKNRPQCD